MSKLIDILKEAKETTMQRFIEKAEIVPGHDLSEGRFNLLEIKEILYDNITKIAEREFRSSF